MNTPYQKLNEQLQNLKQQLDQANIKPHQWFGASDIFHSSCFAMQSDELNDYINELAGNIRRIANVQDITHLEYLTDKIQAQFNCFRNLLNSVELNDKNTAYKRSHSKRINKIKQIAQRATHSSQELYTELSKLQDYERRLQDMVLEKQKQLSAYSGNARRTEYQQQVLLTQQRLGRCRQALSKVEEQIQQLESRN